MTEAVVSCALGRLTELLIYETNFLGHVHEKVEEMQTELRRMQLFLEDVDKQQEQSKSVRGWVSEIREVAYDAENVIETFVMEIASRKGKGFRKHCKRYASIVIEGAKLHKVGKEIDAIRARIISLTTSLQTYGIRMKEGDRSSSMIRRQPQLRRSYSHLVEEHTSGLEEDTKILLGQLVGEQNQGQVVSICGMGGLGKTTLANKVYHHDTVRRHFDCFAWACISQQFQPRDVWEEILIKLVSPSPRDEILKMKDNEIAKELHQVQQEKKCLVILDDIWETEAWDALKPAFPIGKVAGRIILTTRNIAVSFHVDPTGFLHEPRTLTEEESWELLQKKAFPNRNCSDLRLNIDMENLGRKMAGRCAGLPLAITVLGGLLATKHSLNEWSEVHENIDFYFRKGKGHHQQQYSGVHEVLVLSYQELPYQLKACFLYLGHFPEDYDIPTTELFRLWVAEGLVTEMQSEVEGKETMEELAEFYLKELITRCMVQVGKMGATGRVKTCRVHDLMRDLCLLKASQENFLEIVHAKKGIENAMSSRLHRLAQYVDDDYNCDSSFYKSTPYLRSFLFFNMFKERFIGHQLMISTFENFKFLRILSFDWNLTIGEKLVEDIGNLIHLRYLAIKSCEIECLPSSIGKLRYLETLWVQRGTGQRIKVPNEIWNLERLRHLYLGSIEMNMCQLGNLKNLQTLKGFDTRENDVKELAKLTNLKKLEIKFSKSLKEIEVILKPPSVSFYRLSSLVLVTSAIEEIDLKSLFSCCHNLNKLYLHAKINKLPEHQHFPPNLLNLALFYTELEEDPMETLEKLPNLCRLQLYASFEGSKMVCSGKGFPRLKTLILNRLFFMEEWQVNEEAMPFLSQLHIHHCDKLKMLPDGLGFITTLCELEITSMPAKFKKRLHVVNGEDGGEDLYKIQHVPSIIGR